MHTTLVLSTTNGLFKLLNGIQANGFCDDEIPKMKKYGITCEQINIINVESLNVPSIMQGLPNLVHMPILH